MVTLTTETGWAPTQKTHPSTKITLNYHSFASYSELLVDNQNNHVIYGTALTEFSRIWWLTKYSKGEAHVQSQAKQVVDEVHRATRRVHWNKQTLEQTSNVLYCHKTDQHHRWYCIYNRQIDVNYDIPSINQSISKFIKCPLNKTLRSTCYE